MKLCALLPVSILPSFLPSFLLVCTLAAQDFDGPSRGPDGGTRYFVDGIKVLPLPGKPFAGQSSTEWIRASEDGPPVTTHLFAIVAGDSQGRIFREVRTFVPADASEQPKLTEIRILDPVTHTRAFCTVATHHCNVTDYRAPTSFTPLPAGPFDNGKRHLVRESLGSDSIDGLNVIGTCETITMNAGVVGNSRPLITTREFWYSPEL